MAACFALETALEYEKRVGKKISQANIHHGSVIKAIVQKPILSFSFEESPFFATGLGRLTRVFGVAAKQLLLKLDLSLLNFKLFVNGNLSQTPFARHLPGERASRHQK